MFIVHLSRLTYGYIEFSTANTITYMPILIYFTVYHHQGTDGCFVLWVVVLGCLRDILGTTHLSSTTHTHPHLKSRKRKLFSRLQVSIVFHLSHILSCIYLSPLSLELSCLGAWGTFWTPHSCPGSYSHIDIWSLEDVLSFRDFWCQLSSIWSHFHTMSIMSLKLSFLRTWETLSWLPQHFLR